MKPEQTTLSFLELIKEQPQLFQGEAAQDLAQLEAALDQAEFELEEEQVEWVANAIVDFSDSNPEVDQALKQKLTQDPPKVETKITLETIQLLTQKVDQLLEAEQENQPES